MKRYIPFLSLLMIVFGMNTVIASECIDSDCELEVTESEYEILQPQTPTKDVWTESNVDAFGTVDQINTTCDYDYNCPFETIQECEIWYKKPVHKTTILRRSRHLSPIKVDDIMFAIHLQPDFSANDVAAKSLLERYKMLMRASKACCTEGFLQELRDQGANENEIYEFLKDDANTFAIGQRCMVLSDAEITEDYTDDIDGETVADMRNKCLCRNHKWFTSLLQPFVDIYERAPEFALDPFYYTYYDSMKRKITVSVNNDVQNALETLERCPD